MIRSAYNNIRSWRFRLGAHPLTHLNRPNRLSGVTGQLLAYFKSFQIRWYHLVISVLIALLLSPHARATSLPTVGITYKTYPKIKTLTAPPVAVQAKAEPIPVPEPVVPVVVAPVNTAPAGCGDNTYANFIYMHESGCRTNAINEIGACGIGQALPCSKMPCSLSDYACQNSFFTQYVNERYGGWAGAYSWWLGHSWY